MALAITWTDSDIESVARVLREENQFITEETKTLTSTFIADVTAGADLRQAYNHVVSVLLSLPDQLIYFVRKLTFARISLSYKVVPEFKHVVNFYSTMLREVRRVLTVNKTLAK